MSYLFSCFDTHWGSFRIAFCLQNYTVSPDNDEDNGDDCGDGAGGSGNDGYIDTDSSCK